MDYIQNHLENTVRRTSASTDFKESVIIGVMGISGESGELTDYFKKVLFQGHELNNDRVIEELGDIFWYMQYLMDKLGIDFEEVLRMNTIKLSMRYPKGFTVEDSINREV